MYIQHCYQFVLTMLDNVRKINVTIKTQILLNINEYAQFGHLLSISSQEIEKKQNSEFNQET